MGRGGATECGGWMGRAFVTHVASGVRWPPRRTIHEENLQMTAKQSKRTGKRLAREGSAIQALLLATVTACGCLSCGSELGGEEAVGVATEALDIGGLAGLRTMSLNGH